MTSRSALALNAPDVLLLDQHILRQPIDNARRVHRTASKTFDHNVSVLKADLEAFVSKASTSDNAASNEGAIKEVDAMLSRMRGLKRKLVEFEAQQNAADRAARARLDLLRSMPASLAPDDPAYSTWARKRLSLFIVDHLLRHDPPYERSAQALAKHEGIDDLVDWNVWAQLAKADDGLKAHKLDEALAWVTENRAALRKLKVRPCFHRDADMHVTDAARQSPLEFAIHMQAFIELCRARELPQAIAYARKHLAPGTAAAAGGAEALEELRRASALLAFAPSTTCAPYSAMYSTARWQDLRDRFRQTFLQIHGLPPIPVLHIAMQAGLASLKTPVCIPPPAPPGMTTTRADDGDVVMQTASQENGTDGAQQQGTSGSTPSVYLHPKPIPLSECPVCAPSPLHKLAAEVPYSHHELSTIVCRLSGRVIEGGDGSGGELRALVSRDRLQYPRETTGTSTERVARVYSLEELESLAARNPDGQVIDPETGEVYDWSELRKVYIT